MIIGVVPSIKETYLNQIEISLDIKLINFLKKIYKSPKINILHQKKFSEIDLLCLSGGNDLTRFKNVKPNIIRSQLDKFYYQICKKKKYSNFRNLLRCTIYSFIRRWRNEKKKSFRQTRGYFC